MSIFSTPEAVTIRPVRKIGEFTAAVTIEEVATDDLEITKHPVQQGAQITDHAFIKPAALSIKVYYDDSERPLEETYKALLALQASRVPFDVVTGKRIYKNMLLKGLAQTTDRESDNMLGITATLEEVIVVSVQVATVPPRAQQKTPGKTGGTDSAGTKKAQPVGANEKPKQKSALKTLAG